MTPEDRKKEIKMEDLFIDVGAASAEEVAGLGIEIGTPVTIEQELVRLANNRVTGKALDNRVGVLVLIETLKRVKTTMTIYGVFTVQEEVGLKGAKVSAFALQPDIAIATDVTIPGDHPGVTKKEASVEMGKGPVLVLASASGRGLLADNRLVTWLRSAGDKMKIPYQLEVGDGGNTDASIINLVRDGIPSIPLSVATRYIHSPVEVVDLKDVEATIELLVEALKKKPKV
jgi:endoglucanase